MVKLQIVSDVHLEFRETNFKRIIKPSAPILCLLCDISAMGNPDDYETYQQFMQYLSPKFKYIIHVPGNHFYYTTGAKNISIQHSMKYLELKVRKFTKTLPNVIFMNNDTLRLTIDNKKYIFIGSALWTGVRPQDRKKVGGMMNDYSQIIMHNTKPRNMTPEQKAVWKPIRRYNIEDMSRIHVASVRYIRRAMKQIKTDETAILLTHHKPVRDAPLSDMISQAYETDLTKFIIKPPFKIAAHGHTHKRYDKMVNGVRIVSNPKGYISQKTKYDPTFVVDV
jgi:hypothetical protein